MGIALKGFQRNLLERLAQDEVEFVYEPCPRLSNHAKLVRSTISRSQQKHLHALAVLGLASERITGNVNPAAPFSTTVTFALTALGRTELGIRREPEPLKHFTRIASEEELYADGIE